MSDTDALPEPVIEEVTEDPSQDDWTPDFPVVRQGHERLDSRRWLLLPERYTYKPLRALAAAKASDALVASPHGHVLVGIAARALATRRGYAEMLRRELGEEGLGEDEVQEQVDLRMRDHFQLALEEFAREAKIEIYEGWALPWLARCEVHRLPLPSRREGERRDPGGLVAAARGAGEVWKYYEGREVHLVRLAAAVAWGSLGPFLVDLS